MKHHRPLQARRSDLPLAGRTMALRAFARAAEDDDQAPLATAKLVFTTGAPVRRYDWLFDREYLEELVVDAGSVRLDRLKRGAPLLNAHNSWDLEAQLGVVENPSISGGAGECDVTFSRRESVAGYVQDVADRVIRNVSVGYVRHRIEMVPPPKEGGLWRYLVVDWEPYEVSLVPIPADMDAQVRGLAANQPEGRHQVRTFPCEFTEARERSQGTIMPNLNETEDDLPETHLSRSQRRAAVRQESERERQVEEAAQRSADITELCARHGVAHLASGLIRSGSTFDAARHVVLNELAARDAASGGHINLIPSRGAGQSPGDLVLNTLVVRLGGRSDGEVLRNASCVELAARVLEAAGSPVGRFESRDSVISRALSFRGAGMHGTSDFPSLLGDAVGRVLAQMYEENPAALRAVGRLTNLPDFRDRQVVRLGVAPSLEKVGEHGEFTYGSIAEAANTWQLATYGRIFAITRQALVNDDLRGFDTLLARFAQSASRKEAELLVALLLSNPTVDGAVVFDAARSSQITNPLAIAGIGAAVAALRKQTEDGVLVMQEPGALVVPAALEMTARQLVASIAANQVGDVQPWSLDVVVEPRLDAASTTAWYLVARNQRALEYGYLEGQEGLRTFTREGFEVDGVETKARLDFGCGWTSPVGWVKSTGAGS